MPIMAGIATTQSPLKSSNQRRLDITRAFLATEGNPRYKRSPLIALTSKGRALFRKIRNRDTKTVKQMLSHLSETDRRVTQKTLETLLAQLK